VSRAVVAGRYDHAARRQAKRSGRERGCWTYIPFELLPDTLAGPDASPPWYRVWGGSRGRYIVTLYPTA
jgi:hypothetical protein